MTWHRVADAADLPATGPLLVRIRQWEIGIFRVRGELRAWRNVCPHQAAPVCRGTVAGTTLPSAVYSYTYGRRDEILRCPWHGWEFDLLTGRHLVAGSGARLRSYPVELRGDGIYVETRT